MKKKFLFFTIYSQIALIKLSGFVIKPDLNSLSDPATLKYLSETALTFSFLQIFSKKFSVFNLLSE